MRAVALLALGLVLSGCAVGGSKSTTVTVTRTVTSPAGPKKPPAAEAETAFVKYYGIPVKPVMKLDAKRYALTIKPEFFLVGVTANVAFAAGQGNACQPLECPAAEDDRWVIPAGTENLTFILPAKATGTVLTPSSQGLGLTTITEAQLAAVVGGTKTPKLLEPLDSGLWVTVNVDTVTRFAQQFQP